MLTYLPQEILLLILNRLLPEDLLTLSQVNHFFQCLTNDEILWKRKFAQHFQGAVVKGKKTREIFKLWYKTEYSSLSNMQRKLSSLVKENDGKRLLAFLIEGKVTIEELFKIKTANESDFFTLANSLNTTAVLQAVYQYAKERYTTAKATGTIKRNWISLSHIAIACQQNAAELERLIKEEGCALFESELHFAASIGNLAIVKYYSDNFPASAYWIDDTAKLPIHYAAENGQLTIIHYFLQQNPALVNATDKKGRSPLYFAIMSGHYTCVKALVAVHPAPLEWYPLPLALMYERFDIALYLIEQGANLNEVKEEITPLLYLLKNSQRSKEKEEFLNIVFKWHRDKIDLTGQIGCDLLCAAIENFFNDGVKILLELGVHPNQNNRQGLRPLYIAADKCNAVATRLLLAAGADYSYSDEKQDYAFTVTKLLSIQKQILLKAIDDFFKWLNDECRIRLFQDQPLACKTILESLQIALQTDIELPDWEVPPPEVYNLPLIFVFYQALRSKCMLSADAEVGNSSLQFR